MDVNQNIKVKKKAVTLPTSELHALEVDCTLELRVSVVVTGDNVYLFLLNNQNNSKTRDTIIREYSIDSTAAVISVPRGTFENDNEIVEWAREVFSVSFEPNLCLNLMYAAYQHLRAAARFHLGQLEVPGHEPKQILNDHSEEVKRQMTDLLAVRGSSGALPGNKKSYILLAREALKTAPKHMRQIDYYEHILAYLEENHPGYATKSAESLRKRFRQLGIDMKSLLEKCRSGKL